MRPMNRIAQTKRTSPVSPNPLDLAYYRTAYASAQDPADVFRAVYRRIDTSGTEHVWISLLPLEAAFGMLADAQMRQSFG